VTGSLLDNPQAADEVQALAQRLEDETGIPASHVEKDFWVTEVLRGVVVEATTQGVEVVFKGGTSLSKAFRIIERFSEDVDVLVRFHSDAGQGERDRIRH
jgi:predicted nucleotidyltransferase component of viral defense system